VALKLDELKVGGDDIGVVIVALVIAVVAVLIVYLLGYRLVLRSG
jgi:hypothetical protein